MAAEADPRGVAELIGWIAGVAGAVFAWLFNRNIGHLDAQIAELKKALEQRVTKEEWSDGRDDAKSDRDRMRAQIAELYQRDDKIRDDVGERIDALKERVDERLQGMSKDLTNGLNAIRDKIDELKVRR
jgi:DNA anti-recombination protein RmuC